MGQAMLGVDDLVNARFANLQACPISCCSQIAVPPGFFEVRADDEVGFSYSLTNIYHAGRDAGNAATKGVNAQPDVLGTLTLKLMRIERPQANGTAAAN
jgi:hypothetical protein